MIGKHRPSPLQLWVSACSSLFLMGSWWAAAPDFTSWSHRGEKVFLINNQQDADLPLVSWDLWFRAYQSPHWCFVFHALALLHMSMHIKAMCHSFDVHLLLLIPSNILLLVSVTVCFPSWMFHLPPSEPFLASLPPQPTRPRLARSCHNFSSDTIPQMPARWLVFFPSFIFFSALFLALHSLYSLHLSLSPALTSGINQAKLILSFSRIMNASAVM